MCYNTDNQKARRITMKRVKKAQRTISRPCTICGELILRGQWYEYKENVASYKHLYHTGICNCKEPKFRWFSPLLETPEDENTLVCIKCKRPKHKKDL